MLDYKAIEALHAIIDTQSFESAASKLCITQSAISQRLKSIENYYGEPLLIRNLPYQPTKLGEALLGHYNRVALLEQALQIEHNAKQQIQKISVAINRDSLETWFAAIMAHLNDISPIRLEIIADDQEVTLEYLRKGLVSACASTSAKPISGCQAEFIGFFDYVMVASPHFKKTYFKNTKSIRDNLLTAPAIIFDAIDKLHNSYLQHFFGITDPLINYHTVPSVAGFRQFALDGYAYALVPEIHVANDIKQKKLINLFPDKTWKMPVYWHTWSIKTKAYKEFDELVRKISCKLLNSK